MELFFFSHLALIMQYFRQYYSSNRKIDDDDTQVHKSTSTLKQFPEFCIEFDLNHTTKIGVCGK